LNPEIPWFAEPVRGYYAKKLFLSNRLGGDDSQQRNGYSDGTANVHLLEGRDRQQGYVALDDAENGQQQRKDDGAGFQELCNSCHVISPMVDQKASKAKAMRK
jgi:hypothetical protein